MGLTRGSMHVNGPCNRSSSSMQAFIALDFAVVISGVLA